METKKRSLTLLQKAGRRFQHAEEGLAAIEFGLCIGILMLLLFGGIEISRYILIYQKLQNAVNLESNIVTSINPKTTIVNIAEMDSILAGAVIMMQPYAFTGSNSELILTDIYAPITSSITRPGRPVIKWRYCNNGGYMGLGKRSQLGNVGAAANLAILPNRFAMNQGDEIVAAEIYYSFAPILKGTIAQRLVPTRVIYDVAISVPHYSTLSNLIASNCN